MGLARSAHSNIHSRERRVTYAQHTAGSSVKRLRNSFWALLGRQVSEAPEVVMERVRLAMLVALDDHCGTDQVHMDLAIRFAGDLSELWYMRPDLMQAIASSRDEATAQQVLRGITDLFQGHFSSANASRVRHASKAAR